MNKVVFEPEQTLATAQAVDRRKFIQVASLTAATTALVLSGCNKDDDAGPANVDLGSGDVGVLNYAYALEQLEAAFYAQAVRTPYTNMSTDEMAYLTAIAKHEAIHRDFFKAAINAAAPNQAIGNLTPDFSQVNFSDRNSVLTTARTFEDLGVAAYNGAGKLLKSTTYLLIAGKIVSVEARHAAVIRDLINNGDFAADNIVTATTGLDRAMSVTEVLMAAQAFIKERITGNNVGK